MGCDEDGILSVDRLRAEYEGDVIMYRVIDSIPTTADGKIRYTALSAVMFILDTVWVLSFGKGFPSHTATGVIYI